MGSEHVHDHFPYPRGDVVGVFLDEAALDVACRRLAHADFEPDQYEVLHGESGLARIDAAGEKHGAMGSIFRTLQNLVTDEGEHARRYADYLRQGHYIIGVAVGDDAAAKRRAADALRGADAEFLVSYATNYIEELGTNS